MNLKRFPKTWQEKLEDKILSGEFIPEPVSPELIKEVEYKAKYYLKHGKCPPKKKTIKKSKYKIFNDIMLSYGGWGGGVISEEVGIAFGLKKFKRETVKVEIKVKKGEIVIRRKR